VLYFVDITIRTPWDSNIFAWITSRWFCRYEKRWSPLDGRKTASDNCCSLRWVFILSELNFTLVYYLFVCLYIIRWQHKPVWWIEAGKKEHETNNEYYRDFTQWRARDKTLLGWRNQEWNVWTCSTQGKVSSSHETYPLSSEVMCSQTRL